MTNREKFEQVFGLKMSNPRVCSICLMHDDCRECRFWDKKDCVEEARHFWDMEYQEAAGEKAGDD